MWAGNYFLWYIVPKRNSCIIAHLSKTLLTVTSPLGDKSEYVNPYLPTQSPEEDWSDYMQNLTVTNCYSFKNWWREKIGYKDQRNEGNVQTTLLGPLASWTDEHRTRKLVPLRKIESYIDMIICKLPGWPPTLCLIPWLAVLKKYGHTWRRMSQLRPGVVKRHKTSNR